MLLLVHRTDQEPSQEKAAGRPSQSGLLCEFVSHDMTVQQVKAMLLHKLWLRACIKKAVMFFWLGSFGCETLRFLSRESLSLVLHGCKGLVFQQIQSSLCATPSCEAHGCYVHTCPDRTSKTW